MRALDPANFLWVGQFSPGSPGSVDYQNNGRRIRGTQRILATQGTGAYAKHNGVWRPAPSGANLVPANAAFNSQGGYSLTLPVEDQAVIWYPGGNSEGALIRVAPGQSQQFSPESILFWVYSAPDNIIEFYGPPSEDVYDQIYLASYVRTDDANDASDWSDTFTISAESRKFQWNYVPGFVLGTSDVVFTEVGTNPSLPWVEDTYPPSTSLSTVGSRGRKAPCDRVTQVLVYWPSGELGDPLDSDGRIKASERYLIRHLSGGNASYNGLYQLAGTGSNLVPTNAQFGATGEYTLSGLSFDSVYVWTRVNGTSLKTNGGAGDTLTESAAFQNIDPYTSIKLYGPPNTVIQDTVRLAVLVRTPDADGAEDWIEDFLIPAGTRLFYFPRPAGFTLGTTAINFIELTTNPI